LPQLTFTRYLAALTVVAFHFGGGVRWIDEAPWGLVARQGPTFVSYFFVLSGFVLAVAYPALDDPVERRRFWRARFARIYPLYLLALGLVIALQLPAQDVSPIAAAGQASLLQGFVPQWIPTLNYPGWSISVEAFFYAIFPWLIGWLSARRSIVTMLVAVGVLWLVAQTLYSLFLSVEAAGRLSPAGGLFLRYNPVLFVGSFAWGIAAALVMRKLGAWIGARPWIGRWGADLALIALIATLVAAMLLLPSLSRAMALPVSSDGGLFAPLFALSIMALAIDESRLARTLSWRPLVVLGEASYGVYILQVPVWIVFMIAIRPKLDVGTTGAFFIFVAILTLVSVAVLYAFEKPARAWLRGTRSAALRRPTRPPGNAAARP